MPGRTYVSGGGAYRHGWNGQERTDEISGNGNHNTATHWEYDTRLGVRWNLDPDGVSFWSRYAVNYGMPIKLTDPNGDCPWLLVAALVMTSDVLVAPTNNHEADARAIAEARRDHDIGLITTVLAPGAGNLADKYIIKKIFTKSAPVIIKTGEKEILIASEKLLAREGEKKILEKAGQEVEKKIVENTKEFVSTNLSRLKDKLGQKIGQGRLPFQKSKEGVEKAIETVEKTLEKSSVQTEAFIPKSGGEKVIDIFSKETGYTVRINAETKKFVTLIDEATPAVTKALETGK